MPFVTDAVAHLLFFKEHMLTMHAHHGKFHAHLAVAEGAKNDQSQKSADNFKKDNQAGDHTFYETSKADDQKRLPEYYHFTIVPSIDACVTHDYPPPRV